MMHSKMCAAVMATALALSSTSVFAQTPSSPQQGAADLTTLKTQLKALQQQVNQLEQQQAQQQEQQKAATSPALNKLAKWAEKTKIGGRLYVDATHIGGTRGDGSKVKNAGTGFDLKRFYLSVGHQFNDVWSLHFTSDFRDSRDADGKHNALIYLKKGYVQGRFSGLATLRVGLEGTPWVPYSEDAWGYRWVEKSLTDRAGFGTSADLGASLLGKKGWFSYEVAVLAGGGYHHLVRPSRPDYEARIGVEPIEGLQFAVGGRYGHLGAETANGPAALHSARRLDALVAWHRDNFRLGGEWFGAWNYSPKLITSIQSDRAAGWSLWSAYDFGPVSLFARYDRVRPSRTQDPGFAENYWNVGVAYPVIKGVKVALVYKHERRHGSQKASNNLHSNEVGLWSEIRF